MIGFFTQIICAGVLCTGIIIKKYHWPTRIGGIFGGLTGMTN